MGCRNLLSGPNSNYRLETTVYRPLAQPYGLKISRDHSRLNFFNRWALWVASGLDLKWLAIWASKARTETFRDFEVFLDKNKRSRKGKVF